MKLQLRVAIVIYSNLKIVTIALNSQINKKM